MFSSPLRAWNLLVPVRMIKEECQKSRAKINEELLLVFLLWSWKGSWPWNQKYVTCAQLIVLLDYSVVSDHCRLPFPILKGNIRKVNNYQNNPGFQRFARFRYCHWGWGCNLCPPFGLLCLKIGKVVDSRKLNKSWEDESKANSYEPIHGGCIRHFRQGVPGADA